MAEELRREYATAEEAFAALPAAQQEHAARVGQYMRILFLQACSQELYAFNQKAAARLHENYCDLAAAIGRYHDLGKVMVPEQYHQYRQYFSPEELALYRKHSSDSAALAKNLLSAEKSFPAQEVKYLEEALLSHHECWDGSGFPEGIKESDISIFARLLAVANAIDHISSELRSEQPMDDAIVMLSTESGKQYDPEIIAMLPAVRGKLKRTFSIYAAQTKAIPATEQIIKRSNKRPFELWYSDIILRGKDTPIAYRADIRFRNKKEWMDYEQQDEVIRREKLGNDLGIYMLFEACDTLRRLDTCSISADFISLELPSGWLNRRGCVKDVLQVLNESRTAPERLCINVGKRTMKSRTATMDENLKKIRESGIHILLSDTEASEEAIKTFEAINADILSFTTDWLEGEKAEENITILKVVLEEEKMLLAQDITKRRHQPILNELKVRYAISSFNDLPQRENDLILRELAVQNGTEPKPIAEEQTDDADDTEVADSTENSAAAE